MGKLSSAKKLTDIEKYSIQGMLQNGLGATKIAKALSREKKLVKAYVLEFEEAETAREDLIIDKTAGGNEGVAIMTQAASEKSDGSSSEGSPETTGKSDYVHYIKE